MTNFYACLATVTDFVLLSLQGVDKVSIKKTFRWTCSRFQFTVLNLFGFSIYVSFVWHII